MYIYDLSSPQFLPLKLIAEKFSRNLFSVNKPSTSNKLCNILGIYGLNRWMGIESIYLF